MSYPVELSAPDISRYRVGNTGVEYVHTFDSGQPGPSVCVNAVMHGNEICGAIAVHRLLEAGLRPAQGRLTLCFVNAPAFLQFDPQQPEESRCVEEDLNRVWVTERLDGPDRSVDLERARALRPVFEAQDYLLDIHSMSTRSAPIMLVHGLDKERDLARRMGYPRTVAAGAGHINGRRLIEYAHFNNPNDHRTALLVECGQHWHRDTAIVAMDTALYFLHTLDMLPQGFMAAHLTCQEPEAQQFLDVIEGYSVKTDEFAFAEAFVGLETFEAAGALIATDGGEAVRTPEDGCVLIMPNHKATKGGRAFRLGRPISPPTPHSK